MTSEQQHAIEILRSVSTASITGVLSKLGYNNAWIRGAFPLVSAEQRLVGPAFTMRFIPRREDLINPAGSRPGVSTRTATEAMSSGEIAVVDAMGVTDAGVIGDIVALRMRKRGVAGLVSDGVIRDRAGVLESGLPVWCQGVAAPSPPASLSFIGWQEPIACGGVAVLPGEMIVADGDGAVVIPGPALEQVLEQAPELERMEAWIVSQVEQGAELPGLYPMNEENRARYLASRKG